MKQKCVLFVDDDVDFLRAVKDTFSDEPYRVLTAASGKAALETARKEKPDLVLLDVNMPGMDGGDVAKAIADDDEISSIPVVYLTSLVRPGETGRSGESVAERFIAKTQPPGAIVAEVREILDESRREE